jgi:hypothetical protein
MDGNKIKKIKQDLLIINFGFLKVNANKKDHLAKNILWLGIQNLIFVDLNLLI